MERTIKDQSLAINEHEAELESLHKKMSELEIRLESQEQYSHRTSLRFHNIKVPVNERGLIIHPVNTDDLILDICNTLPGVNLTINDIGRSHVIGRAKSGKCQVIVRFLSYDYRTRNLSVPTLMYREYSDKKAPFHIASLDAKSAFDVVDIAILMRKLHLLDIQPSTWKIIDNLHHDTITCIKWKQQVSDSFDCQQGVKQGGLLSAELYKLYIEDLLKSYEKSKIGCRIGTITINAVACADDIALVSDNSHDLQILVNQAVQYNITHRYKLQPKKSVVIEVNKKGRNQQDKNLPLEINQDDMPTVEKSAHLGILRSKSNQKKTENSQIEQNITKARRIAYSLLSTGFYGKNYFNIFVQNICSTSIDVWTRNSSTKAN